MFNVLRLTSGVLKKLELADLAKLLLISSKTTSSSLSQSEQQQSSSLPRIPERTIVIHHNIDSTSGGAAQSSSAQRFNRHLNNENTASITSSQSMSSTATEKLAVGSAGGIINLKSTKSASESIEDSIEKSTVQDSNNIEKISCEIVMSSSATTTTSDMSNNCNSEASSSSKGCEGSKSSCAASSSSSLSEKSCFTSSLADILKFLELVGNLKHVKRTGWVLRDVKDCESISGHMYRMSMMTFLLDGTEGLDRTKCMELALVHDLAESLVGDITPFCGISKEEKKMRELNAMEDICKLIQPRGKRMFELFLEYEENETPESKFVKDLDRLDMVLQAFEYEKRDDCILKHQEFFDSTHGKFSHPFVVKLVNEIYSQRRSLAENENKQQHEQQQNGFAESSNVDENVAQQKKVSSS